MCIYLIQHLFYFLCSTDFETSWEEEAQRQPSGDSPSQHGHQTSQEMRGGGGLQCQESHSTVLLSSSAFEGLAMLPILKRYPLLPDESKIFCCFVHRGKLICHHENLRCFALHFAASLCHIWLFNQEKCNNTATYAQECLVWSCAQFFQFLSCLIHLSSFFPHCQ